MQSLTRSFTTSGYRECPLSFSNSVLQIPIGAASSVPMLPGLQITSVPQAMNGHVVQRVAHQDKEEQRALQEERAMGRLVAKLPALGEYFVLHKKIGEGTYSSVYLASYKHSKSSRQFAVKHLADNSSLSRVQKELHFMQMIGGQDNVVSVLNHFKSPDKECVVFIMPYLPHRRFSDYVNTMNVDELRLYMKNLFLALRRVHSFHVIHRDVKPGNFLYDRSTQSFLLVDFGLAQEVNENVREKGVKRHAEAENIPTNYSKRKRSSNDEGNYPNRVFISSPLQSRENIMNSSRTDVRHRIFSPAHSPHFAGNLSFREDSPSLTTSDKFNRTGNLSVNSSSRRDPSLGTSLLRTPTDYKLRSADQTFTPLVGSNAPLENFVQVRNSQVVMQKLSQCECWSQPAICGQCVSKRTLTAPRAGTPGFRPPEVLLKYLHQTTAVDMWAAGVILLCVLSGTYPFFKAPSDLAALMEITTIFGTTAVQVLAEKFGRKVSCSTYKPPLDLRKMCRRRRARFTNKKIPASGKCQFCLQNIRDDGCVCFNGPLSSLNLCTDGDAFPDSAYHLLSRLIDLDPDSRITAEEALNHPFITQV